MSVLSLMMQAAALPLVACLAHASTAHLSVSSTTCWLGEKLTSFCAALCGAVLLALQELPDVPVIDQLTVNEYTPGVGIAPHVDTHSSFTGSILSLSLLGSCIMVFKQAYAATSAGGTSTASSSSSSSDCGDSSSLGCQQHAQHGQDRQVNVYLPPRSLVAMTGESRYAW
jgi:alkylated DNA repair protein alkB family protein 8